MMINLRDKGAEIWERQGGLGRVVIALGGVAIAAALPFMGGTILNTPIADYESVLVYPIAMYVLMAIGLNIVIGKSGLLDLGYVAFFAIGAYTMGLLGTKTDLNTWEILPIGIAMAMFSGIILGVPALKLRGDYLAIITLGFGEIVRIVALNLGALGRSEGIINIPTPPTIFGIEYRFDSHRIYYWTLLVLILFAIWMVRRLSVRRFGGMGNIWGVILGAVILGYLPDRIRFISDARLLVFGLVLVIMMNLRPDGLLPRKKREKAIVRKDAS